MAKKEIVIDVTLSIRINTTIEVAENASDEDIMNAASEKFGEYDELIGKLEGVGETNCEAFSFEEVED